MGISEDQIVQLAAARLHEAVRRAVGFMTTYLREPDHVVVILATSKMDDLLLKALRARLLPCEGEDDLLESDRGVGTFSMRIRLAYRLGIIHSSLASVLHVFRRIRNDFAHTFESVRLCDVPHRDRTETVIRPVRNNPQIVSLREAVQTSQAGIDIHTLDFMMASALTIAKLEIILVLVDTVKDELAKIAKYP